jgi:hypothetical protein
VFQVTGGSQQSEFGPRVGLIFDSIAGFHGSFAANFTTSIVGNGDTFSVPEPSSLALAALGFCAAIGLQWTSRRSQRAWRIAPSLNLQPREQQP